MSPLRAAFLTAFGLGHLRPASGTWGSTPPPALVLIALFVLGPRVDTLWWTIDVLLVVIGTIFAVSCLVDGAKAEAHFGAKDPSQVVADEVAGMALTMLAMPWRAMPDGWLANIVFAATAFFAFRICDIVKPPPANGLQRLRGGAGILVDDLVAGVYALIVTQVVVRVVWVGMAGM